MVGSTVALCAEGPEPGLRALLTRGDRRQQRRRHDPPPRPGQPRRVHPVHPPRPVRPQRPERRGQQDRRRPLSRARASWSPPSRRTSASRSSTTSSSTSTRSPTWSQRSAGSNVLPRTGLRRLLRTERADHRLPPSRTASRRSRSSGPATSSTSRRQSPRSDTDIHGPRRPRATWPASSATTSSSGCWRRPSPSTGCRNPMTDRALVNAVAPQLTVDSGFSRHDMVNTGPRLPLGRRQPVPAADRCPSSSTNFGTTSTRAATTATSSSRPSPRTSRPSTSSSV